MMGIPLQWYMRWNAERQIDEAAAAVLGEKHCPKHGDGIWQGWLSCWRCPDKRYVASMDMDLPINRETARQARAARARMVAWMKAGG